jgi:hypothetical protein
MLCSVGLDHVGSFQCGYQEAARSTALAAVPGGVVQSAELETEHGRRIRSFDIKDAGSPSVVEIQIDAKTGAVLSKTVEPPRAQKREAIADQKSKVLTQ